METIFIDFKGQGIKASINKVDFDPAKHKLWADRQEKAPEKLKEKTEEKEFEKSEPLNVTRPAKTRSQK